MTKLEQKQVFEIIQKFFETPPLTIFGTGMSCAIDNIFGMEALKIQLLEKIPDILDDVEKEQWKSVVENLNRYDLEKSLDCITCESLLEKIIKTTGDFVSRYDKQYSKDIFSGEILWPAESLFQKMVNRYGQGLHVATTNYDMLAEYSFEKNGIPYISGFTGNIFRKRDWIKSKRTVQLIQNKWYSRKTIKPCSKEDPHICLHKVHGSLNMFLFNEEIIESNLWLHNVPVNVKRLIITPGALKYEKLHQYRSELLSNFDSAVEIHNTFLFLGFGFNDSQIINQALQTKLFTNKCRCLIITKESNERIENFLSGADNLWLIKKGENSESTFIKNRNYEEPLTISGENLWNISEFSNRFLGGGNE